MRIETFCISMVAALLAGCGNYVKQTDVFRSNYQTRGEPKPMYVDGPKAACESGGLANERDSYLLTIQQAMNELKDSGVPMTATQDRLIAKMRKFTGEVDASYRLAVGQCVTHLLCLSANNFDEPRCYMAARDRDAAETRFSNLSRELNAILGNVEVELAKAKKQKRRGKAKPKDKPVEQKTQIIDCSGPNLLSNQCINIGNRNR